MTTTVSHTVLATLETPVTLVTPLTWIKLAVSFKYISNFSIIVAFLAYYMNAMTVFFVCAPLIIVNFIIILLVQFFELDALVSGVLGNTSTSTSTSYKSYNLQFATLSIIWHLFGVLWVYSIVSKGIIKVYAPNFMGIFFMSCLIAIFYFIVSIKSKIISDDTHTYSGVYGDINYIAYVIAYVIVLFSTCIILYKNDRYKTLDN